MARTLMIQGTASNVGKSLLTAGLCRVYARRGLRVAPFKAQNMALNSYVTPDGLEIGRAQAVQAAAARIAPHTDMNPVLLKPEGDSRSQVVLFGRPWKTLRAAEYYREKPVLWEAVAAALERLDRSYDLVLIEGAGSPAEINLKENEIVNMRVARHLGSPVVLVGDIDRGGVFAFLYGTLELLPPEERELVKGFIINKFRGDISLLGPGLDMLADLTGGVPTLGVVPFQRDILLAQEDSVFLEERLNLPSAGPGAADSAGGGPAGAIDIAVVKLPRISNYDDLDALAAEPGVRIRFIDGPADLGPGAALPHAIIIPGTKTTIADLEWMRRRGLAEAVAACRGLGVAVAGICGGYQMLGASVADDEGVEGRPGTYPGLGLLPLTTRFEREKDTRLVRGSTREGDAVRGYEIHMGRTERSGGAEAFLTLEDGREDGCLSADGRVWGTYLHGVFDAPDFRRRWLRSLGWNGSGRGGDLESLREAEFERLADVLEESLDMNMLDGIIGI